MITRFESTDDIRAAFSAAMSDMYRQEVPAYGSLVDLVEEVNARVQDASPVSDGFWSESNVSGRVARERHGAIRLGSAGELSMMRRIFAVMGMYPVGYYDLSMSGVPVHSTAFRPLGEVALRLAPFRVFTSLLRLDLIDDESLRNEAAVVLAGREIFNKEAILLTEKAERDGGLTERDATTFVGEVLETFRWHDRANVTAELYHRLHNAHRLIADIVSFKGPHINHLTPRTHDIDLVQSLMQRIGVAPKAVVEGPPRRKCPILLRQTSFKALQESVSFRTAGGGWELGSHTARFGEVEQRGIALTPKGRALYDMLLREAHEEVPPAADGSNATLYQSALDRAFQAFPDSWEAIRAQGLGYFNYSVSEKGYEKRGRHGGNLEEWVASGFVRFDPIIYEDFLPVSAAGIFQSNLGDAPRQAFTADPNQQHFEADLGAAVIDGFDHYADIEQASIEACGQVLSRMKVAE